MSNQDSPYAAGHGSYPTPGWQSSNYNGPHPAKPEEGVDVAQLWSTLRSNARLVCLIAVGVFVVVMALTLMARMTFRSTGRLYLGELAGKAPATTELDLSSGGNSEVSSEIEVLRSRSMIKRAVLASGLNVSISPPGWSPPRYWRWLLSGRDYAVVDAAYLHVIPKETSLGDNARSGREYQVKFNTATEYTVTGHSSGRGELGVPLKLQGLTMTLMPGLRGNPKPGAQFTMYVTPAEAVVDSVLESLQVTLPKPAAGQEPVRVLTLEFLDGSPRLAATFLQQLMRGYLWARQTWKTEDAAAAEAFVTKQLSAMQKSLDDTQEKLAEYRSENRVVVLANEAEAMTVQIGKYEEQRVQARLQVASLRDIKRALRDPGAPLEAYMFGEAADDILRDQGSALSSARQKLTELEGQYKPAAPEVQRQRAQVDAQLRMIGNYVSNRLRRAEENLASLDGIIGQFEAKLKTVPSAQLGLAQIGRESEVYSRMYSYLLERQQQAAIVKASTVSKNRILDLPEVPLREDSPKLALHAASGILGLLFGAALVIIRRLFSSLFGSEGEVRSMLGVVPIYASVPERNKHPRPKQGKDEGPREFDVLEQPDPAFIEAFRSLRTNLYRTSREAHGKVVLITAPSPAAGKTMCTLSLAAMLAADNKRVLVIDTDTRNPTHHTLTGLPQEPGLRDLVTRVTTGWRDVVNTCYLSLGWFDTISAGRAAHAEVLSDGYFATFLVNARSHYDFVLLDARSYPAASDALTLAPLSDVVLSVIRIGSSPRKVTEEHLQGMFSVARTFAAVVNGVEASVPYRVAPLHRNPRQLPPGNRAENGVARS